MENRTDKLFHLRTRNVCFLERHLLNDIVSMKIQNVWKIRLRCWLWCRNSKSFKYILKFRRHWLKRRNIITDLNCLISKARTETLIWLLDFESMNTIADWNVELFGRRSRVTVLVNCTFCLSEIMNYQIHSFVLTSTRMSMQLQIHVNIAIIFLPQILLKRSLRQSSRRLCLQQQQSVW